MNKNRFLFLVFSFLLISPVWAQDYLTGLVSNLNKSHSAEAVVSLGVYKSTLLGCFALHEGSESQCASSVNFNPTVNFVYEFLQAPKDGSQAWSMKASGKGEFASSDTIVFTSDASGSISCKATGKIAGAC